VCKPQCKLELKRPPSLSSFRPQLITCRKGSNTSECLTVDQLESLRKLYSNYLDGDQNWIFSGYVPGGELGYPTGLATAEPYQISTDYYKYFVLNDTTWDYHTLNASVIKLGMDINTGQMDVSGLFTVC
jgi:feruloyl esterase